MNATRLPAGGPDDLEQLLRSELGAVADAVGSDRRPAPASAVLARGRTARRRRRAALTGGAALATAAVLALGFGVVGPVQRAERPPAGPDPTDSGLEAWISALPVDRIPGTPRSREGLVAWGGRTQSLPKRAGFSRYAYAYGATDRGLLLLWSTDGAGKPPLHLGWLAADGGWTSVDTVPPGLGAAAVSPDGAQYAFVWTPPAGSTNPDGPTAVVRRVSDDAVVARLAVPARTILVGWLDSGWLLTDNDGTAPRLLRDGVLVPQEDLVPVAPAGKAPTAIYAVHGDVVVYVVPSSKSCPDLPGGTSSLLTMAVRFSGGAVVGRTSLGCFDGESDPVSPDGRYFVRGGDEYTVRRVDDGTPVGAVGPAVPLGSTVAIWEPDGAHLQIETLPDASDRRTTVRCSAADGSCVRQG